MAFVETERLIVRTWMPEDAPAWFAIVSKPAVNRLLPASACPPDVEGIREWIERQMEMQEREGFSMWPVLRKSDGALIGLCGFFRAPDGGVEMGWAFDDAAWGHGYATEAAASALAVAFGTLGMREMAAFIDARNAASIKLANRIGMRFDRVVRTRRRDLLRYTISAG